MSLFIKKNTKVLICLLIVLSLSVIPYLNSLHGEFIYDDFSAIKNNPNVNEKASLAKIWTSDFWGANFKVSHIKTYRPLTTLSFRINHIFSGNKVFSYHLINILLHSLVCLLFFLFTYFYVLKDKFFALMAASLFAVHAIHT